MTNHDIESMKLIKNIIEPSGLINQGTLLDWQTKGEFDEI
jgi:hypothetical protein